ncbi:hypothetical protein [Celerinatantimonas sp. MCCC 1A17872]|uniref:hypothetical protein n=1 Tax=Celerinatantimonas sp. MCCC 1A17872 TaxID=3177514 RepID=UPI0038C591BA
MGIPKLSSVVRMGAIVLVVVVVGYLKIENHRLRGDLSSVNQQLGAAGQREIQLLNTNAAMQATVRTLRLAANQERLAATQMATQRSHWRTVAKQAQATIHKALAHEDCTQRVIPGAAHWLYYTHPNRARHPVQN